MERGVWSVEPDMLSRFGVESGAGYRIPAAPSTAAGKAALFSAFPKILLFT